jgi:glycosyltransferase involved in cell wall biosynthesis
VALEAMAAGLVVLSCNDSVIEILPQKWRSFLAFKPRDSVDLAARIQWLAGQSIETRLSIGRDLMAVVVRDHNLPSLIKRIASVLGDGLQK